MVADTKCVMDKRRWWRQTRNDDSVAVAGRRVTQYEGGVTMMAVAEEKTADETDEIEATMVMD